MGLIGFINLFTPTGSTLTVLLVVFLYLFTNPNDTVLPASSDIPAAKPCSPTDHGDQKPWSLSVSLFGDLTPIRELRVFPNRGSALQFNFYDSCGAVLLSEWKGELEVATDNEEVIEAALHRFEASPTEKNAVFLVLKGKQEGEAQIKATFLSLEGSELSYIFDVHVGTSGSPKAPLKKISLVKDTWWLLCFLFSTGGKLLSLAPPLLSGLLTATRFSLMALLVLAPIYGAYLVLGGRRTSLVQPKAEEKPKDVKKNKKPFDCVPFDYFYEMKLKVGAPEPVPVEPPWWVTFAETGQLAVPNAGNPHMEVRETCFIY